MKILVVGAGFAGAVYARTLADAGHDILVIDQRDHIGGNCYDYANADGVMIHRYGPHIFHTSNDKVVRWLSQFTEWSPYEHRVVAKLENGRLAPMPVNLTTLEQLYDVRLDSQEAAIALLRDKAESIAEPKNAAEYLYSQLGRNVADLFFRRYNKKMWQLDLEELDVSVVKRLKIRLDREDRYFPDDTFQYMPKHGYTAIFEKILDHRLICVETSRAFFHRDEDAADFVFNSMPIDAYFDYKFGHLPYRSIRFHLRTLAAEEVFANTVINNTDEGPITRTTCWNNLPDQPAAAPRVITAEEPCDYMDNGLERYYPVRRADDTIQQVYRKYAEAAAGLAKIKFIGRCGTYQYLDMHQVINQSLVGAEAFLRGLD
jgi:UDP-galactopyranose mutase